MSKKQQILNNWYSSLSEVERAAFAEDGIYNKGKFEEYSPGKFLRRAADDNGEWADWIKAKRRVVFLTKDQNAGDGDCWDVRTEIGRNSIESDSIPSLFYRNLMNIFYGLIKSTGQSVPSFPVSAGDLIALFDSTPIARINVKKLAGKNTVSNDVLIWHMNKYSDFLSQQIENLDANIFVCCSYNQDIGNPILNFLNERTVYNFKKFSDWIYYDDTHKKIAINSYHVSYMGISTEDFYKSITKEFCKFLRQFPNYF